MGMAPKFQSVDDYIAGQPQGVRETLERVRTAIRKALPEAEESIAYNMPAYKRDGQPVLYFAAWKKHVSLYPVGPRIASALGSELQGAVVEKATAQFPWTAPPSVALVAKIVKLRVKELA